VKSDDGVVKSDDRVANGVIWHDGVAKSDEHAQNLAIWHSVTEITHAQTAVTDSKVSDESPQMKMIKKWTLMTGNINERSSNSVIMLDSSIK
jgi:hypothetical protein